MGTSGRRVAGCPQRNTLTLAAEKRAPQPHTIMAEPGPKSTAATVCFQLFTFRLWMTAFALFDGQ